MRCCSIDWKTLAIGVLLGACVMLARQSLQSAPAAAPPAPSSPRYQIAAYPSSTPGETIIWALDHQTNKVWQYKGNWERGFTREEALTLSDAQTQRR
jgi:hypothetical protein